MMSRFDIILFSKKVKREVEPGGYGIGYSGKWWSATDSTTLLAHFRYISNESDRLHRMSYHKSCGFSVRLVQDN